MSMMQRSAFFPTSRVPTRRSRPRTLAPSQVAIRRTVRADMTVGSRRADFLQFCSGVHLLEHVKIVVAGAAVRSQADDDSLLQHGGYGGHAGGQFHIALRIVDHLAAMIGKDDAYPHHPSQRSERQRISRRAFPISFRNVVARFPNFSFSCFASALFSRKCVDRGTW